MTATGMARKVDSLGRVVLPAEMRRMFGIGEGDLVEISVEGNSIVLTKVEARCVFCGDADTLVEFSGRLVCGSCLSALTLVDRAPTR
jgi:AbrB family transcriptional regulator, transcriptional pleiotropic regulator of transition state genes